MKPYAEWQTNFTYTENKAIGSSATVGVNVGSTINMGDFQSLRVDCWLTDELLDGETHTEGLQRLTEVASEHLRYMADELAN